MKPLRDQVIVVTSATSGNGLAIVEEVVQRGVSRRGDCAIVEQGPYCATKHAVQALTDTLRMELEQAGARISVTLIKPGAIDTPFPEHARNFMDQPPRLPPPLYAPSVVADAVLFACETTRRTLYVGGGGLLSSLLSRAAPRVSDKIMELVGTVVQQKPNDPGDPARRDNLYEPHVDAWRGTQHVHARKSGTALQAQKSPRGRSVAKCRRSRDSGRNQSPEEYYPVTPDADRAGAAHDFDVVIVLSGGNALGAFNAGV